MAPFSKYVGKEPGFSVWGPSARRKLALAIQAAILAGCAGGTPQSREAEHMKKGSDFLTKKDFRRAIIEFKVASQNMPKDAEPVYRLGMAYMQAGAAQQALESFQKAVIVDPRHEGSRYELALFKVGSEKPEIVQDAKQVIAEKLKTNGNDAEALASMALAEVKLGNDEAGLKTLTEAISKNPSNTRPASVIIAFYAAKGRIDTAREVARTLIEKMPDSPEVAVLGAEVALATKDIPAADREISRALTLKRDFRPALQMRLRREIMSSNAQDAEATTKLLSKTPEKQTWSAYARMLFAEKKIDEGIAEFERVLKDHGDDTEIRDQYSAMLVTAGRQKEAEAVLAKTIAKAPQDRAALMQRLVLRMDQGKVDEAAKDVRALQELKVASPLFSYQQARVFAARGETLRQGDLLLETLKLDPHFLRARLDLAQVLLTAGKTKNATETLDQADPDQKFSVEYVYTYNMALMAEGRWAEARKALDSALGKVRSPGFLYQDAVIRAQNQDLSGARKSLEAAFAVAPSDRGTLSMLGQIMRQQGDQKKFLSMLKEAVVRYPESAPLQNALGAQLAEAGDLTGARTAFSAARAAGDVVNADLETAYVDLRSGALDNARNRLNELIKTHDSARVRMLLADVENRKGSSPEIAVQHYLKAIQFESTNAGAMNNLAETLASRQNKLDDAVFWAQKALALTPNNPAVQDTFGWSLFRQAKYDAALPHLESSAKNLDRAVAHYHLAAVLAKLGDLNRARREYQTALKQDPNSPARAETATLFDK